jgi:hypothetical protein
MTFLTSRVIGMISAYGPVTPLLVRVDLEM